MIRKFGISDGFSALCYQSELIEEHDIDLYKNIETNKLKSKPYSLKYGQCNMHLHKITWLMLLSYRT